MSSFSLESDNFEGDVLRALRDLQPADDRAIHERLLAGPRRTLVMYSDRTIESVLFEAQRRGLAAEVDVVAQFHPSGTPSPIARRLWRLVDNG